MIRDVRDEAMRLMRDEYPAVLAQVASEYGANAPPPRSVSRSRRGHKSYPLAVVRPPSAKGDDRYSTVTSAHGDLLMWVVVWVLGSSDATREETLEIHGEAITRLFHGRRGGPAMVFRFAAEEFSPLGKEDSDTVQAVGIQLRITTATSLG